MKNAKSILCEQDEKIEHCAECGEELIIENGIKFCPNDKSIKTKQKGCGKYVEFWGRYCGQFEDLKHSDHIILCPKCREKENSKQ